jgi:RNA polymerase sigma-70 factor (ECF subfamily)
MTRCRSRAEDIAQDAFVRFYRNVSRCRDQERLGPYLFRIATNLAVSQVRRERRWLQLVPMLSPSEPARATDAQLFTNEIQRQVTAALDRLPFLYRAPLVLFEIEEWAQEDIAAALGCRLGTVKSRISRARALMRRQLESWWMGDKNGQDREPHEATAACDGIASIQG